MFFKDIVGQQEVIERLVKDAQAGTVPHALLFCGPEGVGKLQTAIAFSRYLLCRDKGSAAESCGTCPACVKMDKLVHPDLHFVFPVINKSKSAGRSTVSDDEIATWRDTVLERQYFGFEDWLTAIDADNKQARIFVTESESILSKLSLMSVEGGYKIMIIWHAEKMNAECANSILKLLEEPPAGTIFILTTDAPEQMLETIISRTQRIEFKRIPEQLIEQRLTGPGYMLDADTAAKIAHLSGGSWLKAMSALRVNAESDEFFDYFTRLMRLSYGRKLKDLKLWADGIAGGGREWQKRFLAYCQRMIRENFICNFHNPDLNYMTEQERQFSVKFAPFVNENNIIGLMDVLSDAQRDIEQNVNSKMVFFDLTLKTIMLMKQ
ncbi:MAG: DNA polymerase III subunit delta' [Bacteroidaceae bacterium]|nr:DNA polymerase III subunit delta' [Bacteroidaceae bacterium]